ncbi:IS3 family transposase, partial [Escherichia coli]|uniref:IS3 family transposase n=2 Tax=Enterobacterales TaxID=91347 RepID=UPI0039BDD18C
QESRLPPGSDFRRWVWITIAPFVTFSNISELKDAVTEYIEYYNSRRISLKLKGLTPIEYRNQTYMPRV